MGDEVDEMDTDLPYLNLGTNLTAEKAALGQGHTCLLFTNDSQVFRLNWSAWTRLH